MICVDASQDSEYEFRDFLKVLHAARSKYGIRVEPLDASVELADVLNALRSGECDRSKAHFVTFKVHYPDNAQPAALVYCKLSVTGDEALDLVERTRAKGTFPHDPTSDQFLLPNIFESYLELGRHIGEQVDKFVCEGALDSFSIGQGWCMDDSRNSKETDCVSTDNPQKVVHVLDDAQFDEKGVDQAINILEQFSREQLSQSNDAVSACDTSALEIVSSWARDHGIDASRALRRRFCKAAIDQVDHFATTIRANSVVRLHYCLMLESLGDGVPDARQTLKRLAMSDIVT